MWCTEYRLCSAPYTIVHTRQVYNVVYGEAPCYPENQLEEALIDYLVLTPKLLPCNNLGNREASFD